MPHITLAQHKRIRELVKELGDYALAKQPEVVADASLHERKSDQSIVTIVDKTISNRLIRELAAITPGIEVLSEEGSNQMAQIQAAASARKPIWVVDPLDGTASYTNGYKEYAVNVGLLVPDAQGQMKPEIGFVYFPGQHSFLYTNPQGKAVEWDTDTNHYRQCKPLRHADSNQPIKVAIGWRKGDDCSKSPFAELQVEQEKYTGPYRAAQVMTGRCHASVMNGGVSIWDTAGIEAVARAAGLNFMPFDDTSRNFSEHGMYYGADTPHHYRNHPLANPPYICASAQILTSLGVKPPAYAESAGKGR